MHTSSRPTIAIMSNVVVRCNDRPFSSYLAPSTKCTRYAKTVYVLSPYLKPTGQQSSRDLTREILFARSHYFFSSLSFLPIFLAFLVTSYAFGSSSSHSESPPLGFEKLFRYFDSSFFYFWQWLHRVEYMYVGINKTSSSRVQFSSLGMFFEDNYANIDLFLFHNIRSGTWYVVHRKLALMKKFRFVFNSIEYYRVSQLVLFLWNVPRNELINVTINVVQFIFW